MPDYIEPGVKVFQEFQQTAAGITVQLPAFIFGPQYQPFRYDVAAEKILAAIGAYSYSDGLASAWPNKPANSDVDESWTRVFIDSAWLQYYRDQVGSGDVVKAVEGYANRVRFDTYNVATYGTWPRASVFRERDVQPGDGIILRANACGEDIVFYSTVNRLIHEAVDATIGAGYSDSANAPTTVELATDTLIAGDAGTVDVATSAVGYDGTEDGDTVDSYTATVFVAGDFGTAQLTILSASGNDDPIDTVIPADGVAFALGSRGATATFSTASGSPTPFVAGQIWRFDVNQAWTPPVMTVAGTYAGVNDGTYIATVVEGGLWSGGTPKVFVASTGTLDSSGPYDIVDDTYVTLPSGVKIKFNGLSSGLNKDDKYYVDVTAQGDGALKTLELRNSLPDELFGICYPGDTASPVDLDISMSIVKNVEIPRVRVGVLTNWETTPTSIQLEAGILGTDTTWYTSGGALIEMPILFGDTYTQYRALLKDWIAQMGSVADPALVEGMLGVTDDTNPLALGVLKAATNSNSQPVYFMGTDGTDSAAFSAVLAAIYDREDVYGLVPLTNDKAVYDLVHGSAEAASTPDRGRWRVGWFSAQVEEETVVLADDSGDILYCTISEDGDTPGVQYTRLRCDEAQFITNGVLGGMIIRTGYYVDPYTNEEVYTEYIIDEIISEEELRLVTGPDSPVTVAIKFEAWKNNTKDEMAQQVSSLAGSFSSSRARVVWPDMAGNGGVVINGMYMCAALAGTRSGVAVHQGLTNWEVAGFDDVTRTTEFFGGEQLDAMASNGVWIVTTDATGLITTRHQLTTDMSDINVREDSMVSNMDALSYRFLRFLRNARYIGRRNITPALTAQLEADLVGEVESIIYEGQNTALGPQLISAVLSTIERHPTLRDKLVGILAVDMPEPFNNFDLTILALAL